MPRTDRPRVLLLWPGGLLQAGANFGVPQLLLLASAIRREVSEAHVDVVDLDQERAFGAVHLQRIVASGYDLIGVSCYSSFDYLKVMALAARLKQLCPRAWLVTGGYHPSARPDDFVGLVQGLAPEPVPSPIDFVVVGDGERPLARLVRALVSGKRPLNPVLGPEPVPAPAELMPYDWQLLRRYRPTARKLSSQAEIYLSRGCPFDCAFCMERAKRDTSWRALPPGQALEELHRLDRFLDLSSWTLFIADALFGMKTSWRRELLEGLARTPLRARKIWLLIRVDLLERDDLELMAKANVAPGFGLESGDPAHLKRIRKAGKLESYLEKMLQVADWTKRFQVPFGANIIVGHPGETESSLRVTADYLRRLFGADRDADTLGFLSVDPFRLYPGSPIDEERDQWQADTGFHPHRFPWWYDGDQELLSEWVDPSFELDFRRTQTLRHQLLDPVVEHIGRRFAYPGASHDYFRRSVDEQLTQIDADARLHQLGLWHLWRGLLGNDDGGPTLAADTELAELARQARRRTLDAESIGEGRVREVLERVPRERFVDASLLRLSPRDVAIALDESGDATVSALHAYATAFEALGLQPGDSYAELGSGTGYGATLAAELVGPSGRVTTLEAEPSLAARARQLLAPLPQVTAHAASAHRVELWRGNPKVWCTFALPALPESWKQAMPLGGLLLAPIGPSTRQQLTLFQRSHAGISEQILGSVRFVRDRGQPQPAVDAPPA